MQKTRITDDARQLGRAIDRQRDEIERRWLARVEKDIVTTPGIEITQLRDELPAYLASIVELLSHDREPLDPTSTAVWAKVAREHAVTRVHIGFDISQLVHEFVVLRNVIRDVLVESGVKVDGSAPLLVEIIDAAVTAAVQAYVDARDYEARQRQAENIGFLTHELRNPLSSAVLATSKLRLHATPEQQRALEILERTHRRLAELIDSVLLTEKLETGKVDVERADVKLGPFMEGALEAARANASHKGLRFTTDYDPELVVHLDPLLTRSAVQNLVDNSAKYTDAGGVEVSVEDGSDALVIHVRDTGGGISPVELRTIFEPFRRGTTKQSGTGLGLAIASRAIQAQGGTLQAESPGESGCHFWITLPKRSGE